MLRGLGHNKRIQSCHETVWHLSSLEWGAVGATDAGRLRYSIPVFLAPAAAVAGPRLSARIEADGRGQRHLRVDNSGDRHARIANLSFVGTGGREHLLAPNLAGYVLPGRYKHWPMPEDAGEPHYGRFQAEVDGTPPCWCRHRTCSAAADPPGPGRLPGTGPVAILPRLCPSPACRETAHAGRRVAGSSDPRRIHT